MDKQTIVRIASEFVQTEINYVSSDKALNEELAGMKIFDEPIFAYGAADDEGFQLLKSPSVIGEHFMKPREWLPSANTVIVYFFPFTDEIRESNRKVMSWPSNEWLHGRIDGHEFMREFSLFLNSRLNDEGYKSLVPGLDSRFKSTGFTSNWSERHAAYICGLGTFGLSKGIITEKGTAGRFGSIVTELRLKPDIKKYNSIYEYCINCGVCAENCPAEAISTEKGKDHKRCSDFLDIVKEKHKPYYGCGKCQVGVPCENRNPKD
ncbi:MAG TPA: 4Fe-4S binding protein [Sedimentibacter sp.]|jgi:epoxyqueuosine reductase QueG|nr:4Fe-4S binding protein [Sedimentibacter sp.]